MNAYPLHWPTQYPRTQRPRRSVFKTNYANGNKHHSMDRTTRELSSELARLGAQNVVLSTNVQLRIDGWPYSNQVSPHDTGAAVYFELKGRKIALACDRWDRVECNVWSLAKHIEALRGQQRWGVGSVDQAFAGYQQLADRGTKPWHEVLGVPSTATAGQVIDRWRDLAKKHHPDAGGSADVMSEINEAYQTFKRSVGL